MMIREVAAVPDVGEEGEVRAALARAVAGWRRSPGGCEEVPATAAELQVWEEMSRRFARVYEDEAPEGDSDA
jgi:hypothetical protein